MRIQETFKFWNLVRLILEVLRYDKLRRLKCFASMHEMCMSVTLMFHKITNSEKGCFVLWMITYPVFYLWLSKVSADDRRRYPCIGFSRWMSPCSARNTTGLDLWYACKWLATVETNRKYNFVFRTLSQWPYNQTYRYPQTTMTTKVKQTAFPSLVIPWNFGVPAAFAMPIGPELLMPRNRNGRKSQTPWPPQETYSYEKSCRLHCNYVIMNAMASQITSFTIVYPSVYLGTDQRKHQSSASLAFVREFTGDRWFPHKRQVKRKIFPFGDVIMLEEGCDGDIIDSTLTSLSPINIIHIR